MTQIFVSYSRRDLEFVERLAGDLQANGLQVWFDLSGLEVGTRWGREIQSAIQQSQYFLVVLSPNSIDSEWVEKEFLYANSLKLKIIPLLYKPCSMPMWFINLHFIDVQGKNYELHFPLLLKGLGILQTAGMGKQEEPAAEVHPLNAMPEKKEQPPGSITSVAAPPPSPQIHKPVEHPPKPKEKPPLREKFSPEKPKPPRKKIKLRPIWILLPLGLAAIIAFVIWGVPLLSASLVRTPEGLSTPSNTSDAASAEPHEKVTIVIGVTDPVVSLDPADAFSALDAELILNTSTGLLALKPGTADLEPVLAQDLPEISADGLSYTLKLRPGIKFADGLELTAPLYAAQLNRLLTIGPSCPNDAADALVIPYVERISAPDEITLVFKLKNPAAYFSQLLATTPYVPSHPDTFPLDKCVLLPAAPVYGVGPWFISQYSRDVQLVLEPNLFYSGPYPAQVDQIVLRTFTDSQTLASALRNGEIDIAWHSVDAEQIAQLNITSGVTVGSIPYGRILFLTINHTMAPMDDPNVRKAIASAIDRNAIADTVFGGNAAPLYSMIPAGMLGATDAFDTIYTAPDLDQAKQYLLASGYTDTHKLVLDLWYPTDHYGPLTDAWMEMIKQQLEVSGAITVDLHSQEWTEYMHTLNSENPHPAGAQGWGLDFPDPANVMDPFTYNGGMGNNITTAQEGNFYGIPINEKARQLVDLLSQADEEIDQTHRAQLYREAQDLYADLVVTIPLFLESEHILYRENIHASDQFPTPETLNIGPAVMLNYSLLTKDP